LTPKLNGLRVQTRNAGEGADGRSVGVVGKRSDIPAALRLTHAAEEQVDLVVVAGKLRVRIGLADLTLAVMHNWFRH
jgi:urease beta subunit